MVDIFRVRTLHASGGGPGTEAIIAAVARGTGGASSTSLVHLCSLKIASFRIVADHKRGVSGTTLISLLNDWNLEIFNSRQSFKKFS